MSEIYNTRIESEKVLITPNEIRSLFPVSDKAGEVVRKAREECRQAIAGEDQRLLIIVGPCSIHDKDSALEYAEKLVRIKEKISSTMIVLMRVYFEKPRTTIGWKGLVNDPDLDGSFRLDKGLKLAREILSEINDLGLPCATEFLDPIIPAYLSDLVSWCAIGARTTESQTHRQMASGLSMPVGFKNSTSGDIETAMNAIKSAGTPHAFLGINGGGRVNVLKTTGNQDTHIILRGGLRGANCSVDDIEKTAREIDQKESKRLIMVDCSHGNAEGEYIAQLKVFNSLLSYYIEHRNAILGMMVESNLYPGRQEFLGNLRYGVSVTDACIGWLETESILMEGSRRIKDG